MAARFILKSSELEDPERAVDGRSHPAERHSYEAVRRRLLQEKNRLNPYPEKTYHTVGHACDRYRSLKEILQREKGFLVTDSWLKAAEIYTWYNLGSLADSGGYLTAFFNAELPGAFIAAITHLCPAPVRWVASSLYPRGGKGALSDKYKLLETHRDQWIMDGPDDPWPSPAGLAMEPEANSGDLTNPRDIAGLAKRVRTRFPAGVMLYTSDAAIGVGTNYDEQEEINLTAQVGQALCGMAALANGGTALLKMYTTFRPLTRSLLTCISMYFESVEFFKPRASRPADSEVYLVCRGYTKMPLVCICDLLEALPALGPEDVLRGYEINKALDMRVLDISATLAHAQGGALHELAQLLSIHPSAKWDKEARRLKKISEEAASAWLAEIVDP